MNHIALVSSLKRTMYMAYRTYLLFTEKIRGIDICEAEIIKDVHQDLTRNFHYSLSGKRFLEGALKKLPITSDDALLDFGCGKGGALVTFSKYPFRKLGGIELSSQLYTIAQNNMARLKLAHVELFCCDAAEFTALDDYTYLYFFNPFSSAVMEPVIRNVIASLQSRPRKLTIIYKNPVCHDIIMKTGVFVKTAEFSLKDSHPCFIYQHTQA